MKNIRLNVIITTLLVILLTGCAGIGPGTITRDQFDYVGAISDSWKKQMLLNLIKIRYADAPMFLEVSSIINQYEVEREINLSATWSNIDSQTVGGSGKYSDRPTITYNLLTGEKFFLNLMTPIPINGLMLLMQAGYPTDILFRIVVQTINGVDNRFGPKIMERSGDPRFYRLVEAMQRVQKSGGLGIQVKPIDKKEAIVIFFRQRIGDEIDRDISTIRQILGLNPDTQEFRVVYGAFAADDQKIAVLTRSILQIMMELASYIEVPEKDINEGRTVAVANENGSGLSPLMRIRSDTSRPEEAFVVVQYRNNWFWIDDTDFASKRMFLFLMLLISLTDTGDKTGAPIVTVPTN